MKLPAHDEITGLKVATWTIETVDLGGPESATMAVGRTASGMPVAFMPAEDLELLRSESGEL